MNRRQLVSTAVWGAILLVISALVACWVASGSFKVCVGEVDDQFQKTIGALDGVAELSVTLSTTLIGVGVALLIGLKTGLRLTFLTKIIIITAAFFLAQSAFYAVLWRWRVANLWLNKCLELITEPLLTRPYQAHVYFFMAGFVALFILVVVAAFSSKESGEST